MTVGTRYWNRSKQGQFDARVPQAYELLTWGLVPWIESAPARVVLAISL